VLPASSTRRRRKRRRSAFETIRSFPCETTPSVPIYSNLLNALLRHSDLISNRLQRRSSFSSRLNCHIPRNAFRKLPSHALHSLAPSTLSLTDSWGRRGTMLSPCFYVGFEHQMKPTKPLRPRQHRVSCRPQPFSNSCTRQALGFVCLQPPVSFGRPEAAAYSSHARRYNLNRGRVSIHRPRHGVSGARGRDKRPAFEEATGHSLHPDLSSRVSAKGCSPKREPCKSL
jgi:hypothetical protein